MKGSGLRSIAGLLVVLLALAAPTLFADPPKEPWKSCVDPEELFLHGTRASLENRSADAIQIHRRFLSLHPDHALVPEVLYALGHALEAAQQRQEAIQTWKGLRREFPGRPDSEDVLHRIARCAAECVTRQIALNADCNRRLGELRDAEILRLPAHGTEAERKAAREQVANRYQALGEAGASLLSVYHQQAIDAYRELMDTYPRGRHTHDAELWLAGREARYVEFEVERAYRTDEDVTLTLQHSGMGVVSLQVYRIPAARVLDRVRESASADLGTLFTPEDVAAAGPVIERRLPLRSGTDQIASALPLGRLDPGLYIVAVRESYFRAWVPLLVTDLTALEVSQGDQGAVWLLDSSSGAWIEEGTVWAVPNGRAETKPEAPFSVPVGAGIGRFRKPESGANLVVRHGEHLASTSERWGRSSGGGPTSAASMNLVYTDRPIYRPGHRVHYRAILRELAGGQYEIPDAESVQVVLRDPRGNVLHRHSGAPDSFGCLSGSFDLAADGATGTFSISLSAGGQRSFDVEAYRLPVFAVKAAPRRESYSEGETVEIDVEARHFHGRPVTGGRVEVEVRPSARAPHPSLRSPRTLPFSGSARRLPVQPARVVTDASGRAMVRYAAPADDTDSVHYVRVRVQDRSRRPVGDWIEIPVHAGSLSLVLEADGTPAPDRPWSFFARVIRRDGVPAEGVRVAVDAARVRTAENKEYVDPLARVEGTTGSDGLAAFMVHPGAEGMLRLVATAADPEGRPIGYVSDVRVGGWRRRSTAAEPSLSVEFERDGWGAGEEAILQVDNPVAAGDAFLVVAGQGLESVSRVTVPAGMSRIPVKVDPAWFPGVQVQVALVRERRRWVDTAVLRLSPRTHTLDVQVATDQETYGPGETARCRVRVCDAEGRPVTAQLSLGIVDEAVYALREDSVQQFAAQFHHVPWPRPSWRDLLRFTAETTMDCVWVGGGGGGAYGGRLGGRRNLVARGGGGSSTESARPRRDFPDTLYWNAAVETGADGTVEVEVPIADAITTYRIVARAVTLETQVGAGSAALRVDRPFFVQVLTPRHFVPGDRSSIGVVVHPAAGSAQPVELALEVEGATLAGEPGRTLSAGEAGGGRADWFLSVGDVRVVRITCRAKQGDHLDAVETTVPVGPLGPMRPDGIAGSVAGTAAEKVMLARNERHRARNVRVALMAGKAGAVLESLEYLVGYPYGCVEQTLSRFLPTVAYQRALQALGRPPAPALRETPRMVALGLQRLYAMQTHGGGWGWFHGDDAGVLLTSHVLRGLEQARVAGVAVDSEVIARARRWLHGCARESTDPVLLAAIACAAAGDDELGHEVVERAWGARDAAGMTAHGRAFLVSALVRVRRGEDAAREADRLRAAAAESKSEVFWRAQAPRTSWLDSDIEATGDAVRALLALDPADQTAHRAVDWILAARRMGRWGSTRTTAAAVFACTEALIARPEPVELPSCRVAWNGTVLHEGAVGRADEPMVRLEVPEALLRHGSNDFEVIVSGRGLVAFDVRWEEEDLAPSFPLRSSGGIDVTRSYHRLRTDESGTVQVDPQPIRPGETIAADEEIEVCVRVESVRDYEFLLLEDPKPAGFEWLEWSGGSATWSDAFDDRVAFCFTRLGEGTAELRYRLRAETPGTFGVGPAVLTHMYSDRLFSHSASHRLEVE